jgi:hypothetical protein
MNAFHHELDEIILLDESGSEDGEFVYTLKYC